MKFKKDQKVKSETTSVLCRIEAGPFRNREDTFYVVEKLDGNHSGDYTTLLEQYIRPLTPKKGDRVQGLSTEYVYTLEYITDEVALLWREDGCRRQWISPTRKAFDEGWTVLP